MPVKLNEEARKHAEYLIGTRKFVSDDRDAWSEHQPTAEQEDEFIRHHGMTEYARWHLGLDPKHPGDTKGHYKFPYGDFKKVHRCGLLAAESRAGQYKYLDVERAAHELHKMIEAIPA
jgi:hypothetical protein